MEMSPNDQYEIREEETKKAACGGRGTLEQGQMESHELEMKEDFTFFG